MFLFLQAPWVPYCDLIPVNLCFEFQQPQETEPRSELRVEGLFRGKMLEMECQLLMDAHLWNVKSFFRVFFLLPLVSICFYGVWEGAKSIWFSSIYVKYLLGLSDCGHCTHKVMTVESFFRNWKFETQINLPNCPSTPLTILFKFSDCLWMSPCLLQACYKKFTDKQHGLGFWSLHQVRILVFDDHQRGPCSAFKKSMRTLQIIIYFVVTATP